MSKFSLRTKRKTTAEKIIVVTENLLERCENITFSTDSSGSGYIKIKYFEEEYEFPNIQALAKALRKYKEI